ncbi:hypothetical protein DL93DRAFT_2220240 [Clavulina sp. PMI_390]|nr:hypothetical protein DL93DRAFT_2220240 [Clavulina sp. PMI_390]
MHRFFGTPNRAPKPTMSDAIAGNETRIASIEVQIKKLDGELQKFKDQMARMKSGPGKSAVQQRALRVLQQKKQYEAQMASIQQQTFNMESTMMTTENLRNTMITVDAMKAANKQMKKEFGKVSFDVLRASLNDEMQDLLEQANEVQEALGRSYAVPDEIDEEELQAGKQISFSFRQPSPTMWFPLRIGRTISFRRE